MIKTILVPTDFSKNATNALKYAIAFAKKEKAKIILFHAYHVRYISLDVSVDFVAQEVLFTEEAALEKLKLLAKNVEASKIKCELINAEGLAVDQIIKTVKKKKADVVIMGTKGASGLKEVIMGTIAASVIEKCPCPVITVPEKGLFKPIKQIVYATDYHSEDLKAVKELVEIGKLFKSAITIIHFYWFKLDEEKENELLIKFRSKVKSKIRYNKLEFKLQYGDVLADELEKYSKKHSPDLIAMTTHRRNIFDKMFESSSTKKIAYHTKVPLLAFHYNKRV